MCQKNGTIQGCHGYNYDKMEIADSILEEIVSDKTISVGFLQNAFGRFLIKYGGWTIIPLFFLSVLMLSFMSEQTIGVSHGTISQVYIRKVQKFNHATSNRFFDFMEPEDTSRQYLHDDEYNALYIVLDDSTRYTLFNDNDKELILSKNLIGRSVEVHNHLEYKHSSYADVVKSGTNTHDYEDYGKNYDVFVVIDRIVFEDGQIIDFKRDYATFRNYSVFLFCVLTIWFALVVYNFGQTIWRNTPDPAPIKVANTSHHQRNAPHSAITYNICPACNMKLEENDLECPDCGLNLR